jgi:hypothetical protein
MAMRSWTLALLGILAISPVVACDAPDDAPASADDDLTSGGQAAADDRVRALKALTPIREPSPGILPPAEVAKRKGFVQGFYAGRDEDGGACTVHVIHYLFPPSHGRPAHESVWLHAWRDEDVRSFRQFNEDFDVNVTGVERRPVIEDGAAHVLSLSNLVGPGADDIESLDQDADRMNVTLRTIVKGPSSDDARDVEVEVRSFALPDGGVTIRIKKLGSDDVVGCHALAPKPNAR